jgi:membrane protein DedA with SNARE-associated domain
MDSFTDLLIRFAEATNHPAGFAVIAGTSALEYLFPPVPGDSIVLLSGVLVSAYGWSFALVLAAELIGSAAGAMFAFWLGDRLRLRRERHRSAGKQVKDRAMLDRMVARFHRHGAAYLLIHRFLPGVRPLFMIAAGMAGMRRAAVLFWSTLSSLLWSLLLIGLGSLLGANLDDARDTFQRYTWIPILIVATIITILVARWLWSRRQGAGGGGGS